MKFQFLVINIAFLFLFLVSCKKTHINSPNSSINPSTPTQGYDAEISSSRIYTIGGGLLYRSEFAKFYNTTMYPGLSLSSIDAGTVSINNVILRKDLLSLPTSHTYYDTTFTLPETTYTLNVSGSPQFPSVAFPYRQNFPAFNDTMLVPSSVVRNNGLSLQFNNCINTDSVVFIITDNAHTIIKKYAVLNNQVNVMCSSTELTAFTPTNNGKISISLYQENLITVGTRTYKILLEKRYLQQNVQFN